MDDLKGALLCRAVADPQHKRPANYSSSMIWASISKLDLSSRNLETPEILHPENESSWEWSLGLSSGLSLLCLAVPAECCPQTELWRL